MDDNSKHSWIWFIFNLGTIFKDWKPCITFIKSSENALRYLIKDYTALTAHCLGLSKSIKELETRLHQSEESIKDLKLSIRLIEDKLIKYRIVK